MTTCKENCAVIGTFQLGYTLSRFAYLLILKPAMAEFCQQYPGIQLEISVYDGTVNIIKERFDLGIRFGDILEGGVVARPLMKPFREGLYASSAYLSRHGTPEVPADLCHHQLIGYRFITNNRILPLLLNDRGEQLTVEMPGQLISNDIDVMADGIRNGLGIGRLFEPVWQLQPDRERFIPVMERYWKTYPPVPGGGESEPGDGGGQSGTNRRVACTARAAD